MSCSLPFLLLISIVNYSSQFSLLDRVHGKDIRTTIPDFRTSDADVGMRSAHYIGSFRGEPIMTRQDNAFIDDNGVPIPLLPFADFSAEAQNHKVSRTNKIEAMINRHLRRFSS